MWRGNCALEELFARRERLAGGVHRCGAVAARRAAWNLRRRSLADAQTCLREAALLVRLHHPAIMRVVPVFRNGDKVMDGSVDVWVLAVPLPPWTAAHLHAPTSLSGPAGAACWRALTLRSTLRSGHYAAQGGVDAGVRGLAETGSTAATDVFALGRTVAALRDKCFAALRDECTEAERAASAASAAEVDAFVAALTARAGGAYVSALTA